MTAKRLLLPVPICLLALGCTTEPAPPAAQGDDSAASGRSEALVAVDTPDIGNICEHPDLASYDRCESWCTGCNHSPEWFTMANNVIELVDTLMDLNPIDLGLTDCAEATVAAATDLMDLLMELRTLGNGDGARANEIMRLLSDLLDMSCNAISAVNECVPLKNPWIKAGQFFCGLVTTCEYWTQCGIPHLYEGWKKSTCVAQLNGGRPFDDCSAHRDPFAAHNCCIDNVRQLDECDDIPPDEITRYNCPPLGTCLDAQGFGSLYCGGIIERIAEWDRDLDHDPRDSQYDVWSVCAGEAENESLDRACRAVASEMEPESAGDRYYEQCMQDLRDGRMERHPTGGFCKPGSHELYLHPAACNEFHQFLPFYEDNCCKPLAGYCESPFRDRWDHLEDPPEHILRTESAYVVGPDGGASASGDAGMCTDCDGGVCSDCEQECEVCEDPEDDAPEECEQTSCAEGETCFTDERGCCRCVRDDDRCPEGMHEGASGECCYRPEDCPEGTIPLCSAGCCRCWTPDGGVGDGGVSDGGPDEGGVYDDGGGVHDGGVDDGGRSEAGTHDGGLDDLLHDAGVLMPHDASVVLWR